MFNTVGITARDHAFAGNAVYMLTACREDIF